MEPTASSGRKRSPRRRRARRRAGRPRKDAAGPVASDQILQAAEQAFAERGLAGATTREIASRAGLTSAAVHYHHRTKADLWLAVCEAQMQRLAMLLAVAVDLTARASDVVPRFVRAVFDEFRARPAAVRVLGWAILEAEAHDYPQWEMLQRPLLDAAVAYLEQAQSRGEVGREVDVPVVVPLIFAQLMHPFIDSPGHRIYYGADVTDDAHAARVREEMVRAVVAQLGVRGQEAES